MKWVGTVEFEEEANGSLGQSRWKPSPFHLPMDDTLCAARANREKELVCLEETGLIKSPTANGQPLSWPCALWRSQGGGQSVP